MPVGSIATFPRVILCVLATNPKSILDLGIGYGANAAGIRNWYSLDVEIMGVEGFEQYETGMWNLYNDIVIDDIEHYLRTCNRKFDMVLMTDVLEHFDKEKGKEILKLIESVTLKAAVVTTPAVWFDQEAVNGNELERHHCLWTVEDFQEAGWGIVHDGSPDYLGHQMIISDHIVHGLE